MLKLFLLTTAVVFATLAPAFADEMSDGVIRKIDIKNGKVTVKHGEIINLDMPPMSMVFNIKEPALLDGVAKGDKVKFAAMEEDGKLFITEIQAAE